MSSAEVVIPAAAGVTVRNIRPDALANVLQGTPKGWRWYRVADLTLATCTHERVGWIAEVQGHPAGYVVCALVRPRATPPRTGWLRRLSDSVGRFLRRRGVPPLCVELLDLVVP